MGKKKVKCLVRCCKREVQKEAAGVSEMGRIGRFSTTTTNNEWDQCSPGISFTKRDEEKLDVEKNKSWRQEKEGRRVRMKLDEEI